MALKEYQLLYLDNDIPINRSFYCNNGDIKSRGLEVHVLDNSQAKDCTGLTLRMIIKVPSGDIFEATVANGLVTILNATGGIYQVLFPDNMGKGRLIAEIQLSNTIPEVIVSRKFSLVSDGSLTSDGVISALPQGGKLWEIIQNEEQRKTDFDAVLGSLDAEVALKYTELETEYATDLTGVKSQLAEIPNQAYITNKALQAELSALNVKFNPIPMVRAVGDGINDDTTAIQAAIDHIASLGGGVVLIPTGTFLISSTLIMKDKVRVIGQNSDINVYKYNQSFEGVFPTMVKLKDASNCDMVKFPDRSCSASLERMFLHGNRANNTAGRGVYFEGLISPYRSRNKLENVMISYCADRGIENDIYQYEIEIHSTMVFYSGTVLKSAAYIGGQDNNLSEFSAGYNVGDGIEIDYGGALRALNVDSFGNDGYGLVIHDAMSMSLIGITSNRNGKSNLLIYNTDSPGYPPSKLHFVNCRFFECGAGYDEIVFGDGVGTYAPNAVTFVGCDLGSISRASVAGYLVKNNYPTKRDIAFIGCLFNTINYTNIFDIQNFYTVVGCVDNTGSTVESYNKTLKQKNGIEFETLGYDYKNASAQLSVKRFNSINAGGGAVTVTLPKATKMLPGQEIIISKQDASANVVTVAVFAGDAFKTGVLTTLTTNGQTRRFITDGVSAWFAG